MNCRSCGTNLAPGATVCPVCRNPTPYNVAASGNSPQYDPTVLAPKYGTPGGSSNSPQIDPTVAAPGYGTPAAPPPPATAYGAPSYGTPPPPQDPYSQYPNNQYVTPPPPNQYGAPPVQQGGYIPPGSYGMQPPPTKPRRRIGLILAIVGGVIVLACIAASTIGYLVSKSSFSSVKGPSGAYTDATAAGYITNAKLATGVDANDNPTNPTTTFRVNQQIYATFETGASSPDGYIQAKWYLNNTLKLTSRILHSKGGIGSGYLSASSNIAAPGNVELYWCGQSDCSNAKLADVLNFTVA